MEAKEHGIYEKIIKEQDLVSLYIVNNLNKSMGVLEIYSHEPLIYYGDLQKYLLNNKEILEKFSTKNLINILSQVNDNESKEYLVNLIMQRLEKEEFFCEDIEGTNYFMKTVHSIDNFFNKIGVPNIEKIKQKIIPKLQENTNEPIGKIIKNIKDLSEAGNFFKYYNEEIFTPDKIAILEMMLQKDENALRYVNFGIFQDEIFDIGADFVEYISKFPYLSAHLVILQKNNPELCKLLASHIKQYENLPDNYDEIEILITYLTKNCFVLEPENLKDDMETLINCAILNSKATIRNNLIKVEYSQDYNEKLNEAYNEKYQTSIFSFDKIEIIFNKIFSMTKDEAKALLEDYASDLENIPGVSDKDKKAFYQIEKILNLKDEKQMDELFYNIEKLYTPRQIQQLKQRLSKACAIDYSKNMQKVGNYVQNEMENNTQNVEYIEFDGKQIPKIKLTGKFDLLVHSTDTGFISNLDEIPDFSKSWNAGKDKANHIISTSYINQDFLGCAPVYQNGVMYGFSNVNAENIRLMGVTDINTFSNSFAYDSVTRKYMSAKTMPYNSRRVYNEFGIERQGVTPDYVIVFDDMSEAVKQNAYRAANQFGIPILNIDKKEIENQQINNLKMLIEKFQNEKNPEILKQLLNSYETNMAGWLLNRSDKKADDSYTKDIDNSRFKNDFSDIWNKIEITINEYLASIRESQSQENIEDLCMIMQIVLEERDLYENCDEIKPISKTMLSYDSTNIINEINTTFDSLGASQYKVDTTKVPTAKDYKITIKSLMKNALFDGNFVTVQDVTDAEIARNSIENSLEREEK